MASDRQIEANCLNAQKSTGPKTEEGKAASRDNAWKHGMAAEVDELRSPAFLARRASWGQEFRPRTESAEWALDRAVAASLRIDRCDAEFHTMIVDHAERAAINWDLDREAEVAAFARRLDKQPELLSRRLQTN